MFATDVLLILNHMEHAQRSIGVRVTTDGVRDELLLHGRVLFLLDVFCEVFLGFDELMGEWLGVIRRIDTGILYQARFESSQRLHCVILVLFISLRRVSDT